MSVTFSPFTRLIIRPAELKRFNAFVLAVKANL